MKKIYIKPAIDMEVMEPEGLISTSPRLKVVKFTDEVLDISKPTAGNGTGSTAFGAKERTNFYNGYGDDDFDY